jgi:ribosome-binding protein aMBF1 (putative translation factor)
MARTNMKQAWDMLRVAREARGMSVEALASATAIDAATITRIESGRERCDAWGAMTFERLLGVDGWDMLGTSSGAVRRTLRRTGMDVRLGLR